MIDFNKTLIRCSSLSCLFTEPKLKADKEAGKLSKTAQLHLIKTYIREYWGIDKQLATKQIVKGNMCEDDGITMVSVVDGVFYDKNTERRSNEWITGEPDIVHDIIDDVKCSWDAETFLPKLIEPVDATYEYQMQGYMWLFDKPKARVRYCLVTTPETIRNQEKYGLLRRMDVATEENPDFIREWERLEKTMVFDSIPVRERVIDHYVDRDEEIIAQIPIKVERARQFLSEFHSMHTGRFVFS